MRRHDTSRTRPRQPRWRSPAGFTLIELLVTIGIMIFVLGITVVAFAPVFRTAGVKSASHLLRAAVDGARIRAIQQRRYVRFEAQPVPGTTTHQWRVCPNAGDQTQEWKNLPEFVAVATNAGLSPGPDGRDPPYRGAASESATTVQQISVTFGPDGSVKRWSVGGVRQADGTYPDVDDDDDPTGLFAIRLTSMRDASAGQRTQRWLVFIPITGGIQPYDAEGESL